MLHFIMKRRGKQRYTTKWYKVLHFVDVNNTMLLLGNERGGEHNE